MEEHKYIIVQLKWGNKLFTEEIVLWSKQIEDR
jgi:hypothetical protein